MSTDPSAVHCRCFFRTRSVSRDRSHGEQLAGAPPQMFIMGSKRKNRDESAWARALSFPNWSCHNLSQFVPSTVMTDLKPIFRWINRFLPPKGREFTHFAYAGVKSLTGIPLKRKLFGNKADLVPPLHLMQDGNRDYKEFKQNGIVVFNLFRSFGLKPTDRILDIGCGIGRKTIPLLDFLTTGSYEGIDPVQGQIKWCSERITPRYPNVRFHWVDLWSRYYNPNGKIMSSEYVFPFADGEFDFVILSSVFTHMYSADMLHYISEISRLLKPGGGGWVTFFLLNPESEALIAGRKSSVNLVFEAEDGCKADNADRMETAVGHQEALVLQAFQRRGIRVEIKYGSWCGRAIEGERANEYSYQDFVRLTRT